MEGSRLRILQLLQKHGSDTVDGLARALGLAPATIRRHLDILQRDRLVAFKEVRKRTGRPEYSFYLTDGGHESLPKNYGRLLGMVVQEFSALTSAETASRDGQELLELVFLRLSNSVARTYDDEVAGRTISERLPTLMRRLRDDDFFPDAQINGDKLRIRLLNCPFRSVALQNKAVCTFDLNLISMMLGVDVDREECIRDGDSGCAYTAPVASGMSTDPAWLNRESGSPSDAMLR